MTAKPRRYVRVEADDGSVKATCICRGFLGRRNLEWDPDAWASIRRAADHHARTCPAVAIATERDRLQRIIDSQLGGCSCNPDEPASDDNDRCGLHGWSYRDWTDLADGFDEALQRTAGDRDRLAAERDQLRAEASHLRADRAAWRTQAIQLAADLIEAREERAC